MKKIFGFSFLILTLSLFLSGCLSGKGTAKWEKNVSPLAGKPLVLKDNAAPHRIFYTKEVPFDKNGRKINSLWQNADEITDFVRMDRCEKGKLDVKLAMLFDEKNLYLSTSCTSPEPFSAKKEKEMVWSRDHFEFFFPKGKDGYLQILLDTNKEILFIRDSKIVKIPEIRYSLFAEKRGKFHYREAAVTLPFSLLEMRSPGEGEKMLMGVMYSVQDKIWGDLFPVYGVVPLKGVYKDRKNWAETIFVKEESSPLCRSAATEFQRDFRRGTLQLFPEKAKGRYKNILGMNNSPRISSYRRVAKEKALFKRLGPARVRHHDAALTDPGFALIDVTRIFPLFHADYNNPENYNFGPTDLYLKHVQDCGVPIEFRFGESIEHSGTTFRVKPPADPEKFAAICVNILRHYNQSWAKGMRLDIRYASLWEEPDGRSNLFTGPYEKYLELYKAFSRKMKKEFPEVKIGGPQAISLRRIEEFLAYCRKHDLKVDFVGTTAYSRRPESFHKKLMDIRALARKYGYPKAEIFLSEWHLAPRSFSRTNLPERASIENAVFTLSALLQMQKSADMAYYYIWASNGYYGLFSSPSSPYPVYYALCFYTDFIRKNGAAVPIVWKKESPGVSALASLGEKGEIYLLLCKYQGIMEELTLSLPVSYRKCRMQLLSGNSPRGEKIREFTRKKSGDFTIPLPEKLYGAYFLKFEK